MYRACYFILLVFFSNLANAQSDELLYGSSGDFIVGGNGIKFSLKGESVYIDNYLYSDSNKEGTTAFEILPKFEFQMEEKRHLIKVDADVSYTIVQNFSEDDHLDYNLDLDYYYKFLQNGALTLKADKRRDFVYRGTRYSIGTGELLESGDEKDSSAINLGLDYGSSISTARLTSSIGFEESKFSTKRELTRKYDVKTQQFDLGFDYSLSGKTYGSAEIEYSRNSFEFDASRDDTRFSGLIGVKWETSELTKLAVLGGVHQIAFKNSTSTDRNNGRWKVKIDWSPLEFTNFSMVSGRRFENADRGGELFKEVDEHFVYLRQAFSYRFTAAGKIGVRNEISYSDIGEIKDRYGFASAGFKYRWIRIVDFFGAYDFRALRTTGAVTEYDRNQFSLGFKVLI